MNNRRISEATVRRLSHYLRYLAEFEEEGITTASSEQLAARGGVTASQVRKDLSSFGSFGKRGSGYQVDELRRRLMDILGLGVIWRVAMIGAGRIGAALFNYEGFRKQGFHIVAVFDSGPEKIGQLWGGQVVLDVAQLEEVIAQRGIEMAIIATPATSAQEVTTRAVKAGVQGILSFAPVKLEVPPWVTLRYVNMAVELEGLSYALRNGREGSSG